MVTSFSTVECFKMFIIETTELEWWESKPNDETYY